MKLRVLLVFGFGLLTILFKTSSSRRLAEELSPLKGNEDPQGKQQHFIRPVTLQRSPRTTPNEDKYITKLRTLLQYEIAKNSGASPQRQFTRDKILSPSSLDTLNQLNREMMLKSSILHTTPVNSRGRRWHRAQFRLARNLEKLIMMLASRRFYRGPLPGPVVQDQSVRRQQPASPLTMDIAFVVDGSNAIENQGSGNFRKCLEFVKEVVQAFPLSEKGIHTGVVSYGDEAQVNVNFNVHFSQSNFESALDGVNYPGGATKTGNAFGVVIKKLFPGSRRSSARHFMILITGGKSEDDAVPIAEEIRASGVVVFCVGVGNMFDRSQLDAIASAPSTTHVLTASFDDLSSLVLILTGRIRKDIDKGSGQKPDNEKPKSIQAEGGLVEAKIDLGFLIDGSSTVGKDNFQQALNFVRSIYQAFWTPFGSVHVGLVVFGTDTKVTFDFDNTYPDKAAIDTAIDGATYPDGQSVLGGALQATKGFLYGSKHNDGHRRILVVIAGSTAEDDVFLGAGDLRANSVTVFCIGSGPNFDRAQLDGIASQPPESNVLTVPSYAELSSIKQTLINKIEEARTSFLPPQPTPSPNQQQATTQSPFAVTAKPEPTTEPRGASKNKPDSTTPGQTANQPGSNTAGQPGSQSGTNVPGQPGNQPGNQAGTNVSGQPSNKPDNQPSGNQAGNQPGGNQSGNQPGSNVPEQPGNQAGNQPGGNQPANQPDTNVSGQPGNQAGNKPGGNKPANQPGTNVPGQPGNQAGNQPGTNVPGQPGNQGGNQPGGNVPGQPGNQAGKQPGSNVPGQPGNQAGNKPGGNKPANQPGTNVSGQPDNEAGNQPGGNKPANQPGTNVPGQPGNQAGNQPGTNVPGQPGNQGGNQPGGNVPGQPGNQAGNQPGSNVPGQPGNQAGTKPGGNKPANQPGTNVPGQPDNEAGNQPGGNQPANQPGTNVPGQPGIQAGNQPGGNQPGSQPGSNVPGQLGNQAGNQPGTNVTGQPGNQGGNQPGVNVPGQPENQGGNQPGGNVPGQPGNQAGNQPVSNVPGQPGNQAANKPGGNKPANQPGTNVPGQPDNEAGNQPGGNKPANQPGTNVSGQPGIQAGNQPGGNQPGSQPGSNVPGQPGNQAGNQPGTNVTGQPGNQGGNQPGGNVQGQPGNQAGNQPGSNVPGQPGNQASNQPGGNQAGNQPGGNVPGQPGNQAGNQPGSSVPGLPGNEAGNQPGSNVPGQPGNQAGNQPDGNQAGNQPGGNVPGQSGNQAGNQPGSNVAGQPGNQASNQPGSSVPGQPGNQAGNQPGSNLPGQPGNQAGIQTGNQAGNQPGSNVPGQPGNQPGNQPGSNQGGNQPGSNVRGQPGNQAGNQPGSNVSGQLGNQGGNQPGGNVPGQPGNQAGNQPDANQAGNQPGGNMPGQSGNQAGNQPGSNVAGQPGNQASNQPGSNVPGQPGNQAGNQPGYIPPGQLGNPPPSNTGQQGILPISNVPGQPSSYTPGQQNIPPGQPSIQPGYFPWQAGIQTGSFPTQPGFPSSFPGSFSWLPGIQPGFLPRQPGIQPGTIPGQSSIQLGSFPGQTGIQPGSLSGKPGIQPGSYPGQPGIQPGSFLGQSVILIQPGSFPGQPEGQPGTQPNGKPEIKAPALEGIPSECFLGKPGCQPGRPGSASVQPGSSSSIPLNSARPRIERNVSTPGNEPPGSKPGTSTETTNNQGVTSGSRPVKETSNQGENPVLSVTDKRDELDLTFVIDGSNDMSPESFNKAKDFMKKVYNNFPISQDTTHVGFAVYSCSPKVIFTLTEYFTRESLDIAVDSTQHPGCDRNLLGAGLILAKSTIFDISARPGAHKVLVVLPAGKADDDVKTPSREMRDHGVIIFGIAVGSIADVDQLRDFVSAPLKDHLFLSNPDTINQQLAATVENIKQVTNKGAPPNPDEVKMELGFLLDVTSDGFSPEFFPSVLRFIKTIYSSFLIRQDKTRVGVVTYNGSPSLQMELNKYKSKVELDTAIEGLTQLDSPGPGSLGQGLTYTTANLFKGNTRDQTPKILVIIMGKKSRDDVVKPSMEAKGVNTTIIMVGVGSDIDKEELNEIASPYGKEHVVMANYSPKDSAGGNVAAKINKAVQVDIGFLVDGSKSVPKANFIYLLDAIKYIYSAFPVGKEDVHISLGIISTNTEIVFDFDKYFTKPTLDSAVDSAQYPGTGQGGNIGKALITAKDILFDRSSRQLVRRVLVVIVGGRSLDDASDGVRNLRDSKIEVYVFGVGSHVDQKLMTDLASIPHDRHIVTNSNIDGLTPGALELIEKLQIAKVDDIVPPLKIPPPLKGNHTVVIDLVILVEGTDNTKPQDFEQIKEIVKTIYRMFSVSKNGTHVAFAIFGDEMNIVFNLRTYFSVDDMDNVVDSAPYPGGLSQAGNALTEVKTKIFATYGRPDVSQVMLTILTGRPSDSVDEPASNLKSFCVLMFGLGLTSQYSPSHLNTVTNSPRSEYEMVSETFPDDESVGMLMAQKIQKVTSVVQAWNKQCTTRGVTKLDLAFLLDACRNIPSPSFKKVTDIVKAVSQALPSSQGETKLAVLTFSGGVNVVRDFTSQSSDVNTLLDKQMASDVGCPIGEGLTKAKDMFLSQSREGVPHVLVVISGGKSDDDVTIPAQELQEAGVIVFGLGLGNAADYPTLGSLSSVPPTDFILEDPDFPFNTNAQALILKEIRGIFDIGNDLICPPKEGCKPPNAANATPPSTTPTRPTTPLLSPTVPKNVPCHVDTSNRSPIDITFLIDGTDVVNESQFRILLEVARITYHQFPVSKTGVHVAVAVYGSVTAMVFNLDQYYDLNGMDSALMQAKRPGGIPLVGKALTTVKNSIFVASSREGVSKRLIHIMCGKSADDVTGPSKELQDFGVHVIAAGACAEVSKPELCVIGSPPTCQNAVIMRTMTPPSAPACEFAKKILKGVPPKVVTHPTTAVPTTNMTTATTVPSTTPTSPTSRTTSSPTTEPTGKPMVAVHVPVPVPVAVPVPVPVPVVQTSHHFPEDNGVFYPPHRPLGRFPWYPNRRPMVPVSNHMMNGNPYMSHGHPFPHQRRPPMDENPYPIDHTIEHMQNQLMTGNNPFDPVDHTIEHMQNHLIEESPYPNEHPMNRPPSHIRYGRPFNPNRYPHHHSIHTSSDPIYSNVNSMESVPSHDGNKVNEIVDGVVIPEGSLPVDPLHPDPNFRHPPFYHIIHHEHFQHPHGESYGHGIDIGHLKPGQSVFLPPRNPHVYHYGSHAYEPIGTESTMPGHGHPSSVNQQFGVYCADVDPECSMYLQSESCQGGAVGYSREYLLQNCQRTCGLCDSNTVESDNQIKDIWIKKSGIAAQAKSRIKRTLQHQFDESNDSVIKPKAPLNSYTRPTLLLPPTLPTRKRTTSKLTTSSSITGPLPPPTLPSRKTTLSTPVPTGSNRTATLLLPPTLPTTNGSKPSPTNSTRTATLLLPPTLPLCTNTANSTENCTTRPAPLLLPPTLPSRNTTNTSPSNSSWTESTIQPPTVPSRNVTKPTPLSPSVNMTQSLPPTLPSTTATKQQTAGPSKQEPPVLPPTLPYEVKCGIDTSNKGPIDVAFLLDGSDAMNETEFRTLLEIIRITYHQFPVSKDDTHIAVAVYGSVTNIVFNLDQHYDIDAMDSALKQAKIPGGAPFVGQALETVKDSIFIGSSRKDASTIVIHMMCGDPVDEIAGPSKELENEGVTVIATGVCGEVNQPDLCVIGSSPACQNALMMKTMSPLSAPACEFVRKILKGVPPKVVPQPTKAVPTTNMTTSTTGVPTTNTTTPTATSPTTGKPTPGPAGQSLVAVHVPVPVPVPVPVAVDPYTHHVLSGPMGRYPWFLNGHPMGPVPNHIMNGNPMGPVPNQMMNLNPFMPYGKTHHHQNAPHNGQSSTYPVDHTIEHMQNHLMGGNSYPYEYPVYSTPNHLMNGNPFVTNVHQSHHQSGTIMNENSYPIDHTIEQMQNHAMGGSPYSNGNQEYNPPSYLMDGNHLSSNGHSSHHDSGTMNNENSYPIEHIQNHLMGGDSYHDGHHSHGGGNRNGNSLPMDHTIEHMQNHLMGEQYPNEYPVESTPSNMLLGDPFSQTIQDFSKENGLEGDSLLTSNTNGYPIDPLHIDASFRHPVTHHVLHNGRLSPPSQQSYIHITDPSDLMAQQVYETTGTENAVSNLKRTSALNDQLYAHCIDQDPECPMYVQSGYCDGSTVGYSMDYLERNCKKTCGLCESNPGVDKTEKWAKRSKTSKLRSRIKRMLRYRGHKRGFPTKYNGNNASKNKTTTKIPKNSPTRPKAPLPPPTLPPRNTANLSTTPKRSNGAANLLPPPTLPIRNKTRPSSTTSARAAMLLLPPTLPLCSNTTTNCTTRPAPLLPPPTFPLRNVTKPKSPSPSRNIALLFPPTLPSTTATKQQPARTSKQEPPVRPPTFPSTIATRQQPARTSKEERPVLPPTLPSTTATKQQPASTSKQEPPVLPPTLPSTTATKQQPARTSEQEPPVLPPTLPYEVRCGIDTTNKGPIDIAFLLDGSDAMNETEFRILLEIIRITYHQFPVSRNGTHIAVAVYGSVTNIVFNLDTYHDIDAMDSALKQAKPPDGAPLVGQALETVKDSIFIGSSRKDASKVLVHMICGESVDKIIGPSKELKKEGVTVIATGVCAEVNQPELCVIGGSPACQNAFMMKTMSPLNAPACEFVETILKGVPPKIVTHPTKVLSTNVTTPASAVPTSNTTMPTSSPPTTSRPTTTPPSQSLVAIQVPVPVPVPVPVAVDPYTHHMLPGPMGRYPWFLNGHPMGPVPNHIMNVNPFMPYGYPNLYHHGPGESSLYPIDHTIEQMQNHLMGGGSYPNGYPEYNPPSHVMNGNHFASNEHSSHQEDTVMNENSYSVDHTIEQMHTHLMGGDSYSNGHPYHQQSNMVLGDPFSQSVHNLNKENGLEDDSAMEQDANDYPLDVLDLDESFEQPITHHVLRNGRISPLSQKNYEHIIAPVDLMEQQVYEPIGTENTMPYHKHTSPLHDQFFAHCKDQDPECPMYAQSGYCDESTVGYSNEYLVQNCKKTCGLCESNPGVEEKRKWTKNSKTPTFRPRIKQMLQHRRTKRELPNKSTGDNNNKNTTPNNTTSTSNTREFKPLLNLTLPTRRVTTAKPTRNILPLFPPLLPSCHPNCCVDAATKFPLDIAFLIDGSDAVNGMQFRTFLDIVKSTYQQFQISKEGTHIAVAVYGSATNIVFNFNEYFEAKDMDADLKELGRPGGAPLAGKALKDVKDAIFVSTSREGVSKRLIHMMCGRAGDDIIKPSSDVRNTGVTILAAGACPEVNKRDLCIVGSPPPCENAVMIRTLQPPTAPACEFADKILKDVPSKPVTKPPKTIPTTTTTPIPTTITSPIPTTITTPIPTTITTPIPTTITTPIPTTITTLIPTTTTTPISTTTTTQVATSKATETTTVSPTVKMTSPPSVPTNLPSPIPGPTAQSVVAIYVPIPVPIPIPVPVPVNHHPHPVPHHHAHTGHPIGHIDNHVIGWNPFIDQATHGEPESYMVNNPLHHYEYPVASVPNQVIDEDTLSNGFQGHGKAFPVDPLNPDPNYRHPVSHHLIHSENMFAPPELLHSHGTPAESIFPMNPVEPDSIYQHPVSYHMVHTGELDSSPDLNSHGMTGDGTLPDGSAAFDPSFRHEVSHRKTEQSENKHEPSPFSKNSHKHAAETDSFTSKDAHLEHHGNAGVGKENNVQVEEAHSLANDLFHDRCTDVDPACSTYVKSGWDCSGVSFGYSNSYIRKHCKKTCGLCKSDAIEDDMANNWDKKSNNPKFRPRLKKLLRSWRKRNELPSKTKQKPPQEN